MPIQQFEQQEQMRGCAVATSPHNNADGMARSGMSNSRGQHNKGKPSYGGQQRGRFPTQRRRSSQNDSTTAMTGPAMAPIAPQPTPLPVMRAANGTTPAPSALASELTVPVMINGLPNSLCSKAYLETAMEQAGLEDDLVSCEAWKGETHGNAAGFFKTLQAATKCVAHFNGCRWDIKGPPVSASLATLVPVRPASPGIWCPQQVTGEAPTALPMVSTPTPSNGSRSTDFSGVCHPEGPSSDDAHEDSTSAGASEGSPTTSMDGAEFAYDTDDGF